MRVLQATINETQKGVTGTVKVKLYKGNCVVVGRRSLHSLYHKDYATFDGDQVYHYYNDYTHPTQITISSHTNTS